MKGQPGKKRKDRVLNALERKAPTTEKIGKTVGEFQGGPTSLKEGTPWRTRRRAVEARAIGRPYASDVEPEKDSWEGQQVGALE